MNDSPARALIDSAHVRRLELMARLLDATSPRAVAAEIAGMFEGVRACRKARVVWNVATSEETQSEPPSRLEPHELALARAAVANHEGPVTEGESIAFPLFAEDGHSSILLLEATSLVDAEHLLAERSVELAAAGRQLQHALEIADLRDALQRLERSENLQRALFAISELASSDRDMNEMLSGIHTIVAGLMYAENFFIVRYDADADSLRFLYYADAMDPEPPDSETDIPLQAHQHSLTWYLLRDGKPLRGSTPDLRGQVSGPLSILGPDSEDWLGVPMSRDGRALGAVVVQSYECGVRFTDEDRALLEFVSRHILVALERKQGKQALELQVRKRTAELAEANQELMREISERQRAERLQSALFQIAQLATSDIGQLEFFQRTHRIVGTLINAENFYIALLSADRASLEFAYYVDKVEQSPPARPLGAGLSEYVLKHGKTLLRRTDILDLVRKGVVDPDFAVSSGRPDACWLGVPLVVDGSNIGLVSVQSIEDENAYESVDVELLGFVASQIANSLQRRLAADSLRAAYAQLQRRVEERTRELHERNAELEVAYAKLKNAQEQAIQSEKLASIGQLAAGVAHEINNPIGYVSSNLSTLQDYMSKLLGAVNAYAAQANARDAIAAMESERIRRDAEIDFLSTDAPQLISESREGIDRVCKIVRDLKDFSRRDRNEAWVNADVHQGLESTLNIVSNQIKYKAQIVKTFGDLPMIECLPSELNQVFLNILMNAAQAVQKNGLITVSTGLDGDKVWIAIGDDGEGIPPDVLPRIFDPFFTTKPVGTGTGLGLSISYGIVAKHHGNIEVTSVPRQGTLMRVELPVVQPK
ncbi:MAG: GAF domain-containing protein [Xanthomonadaceae bacterium]|nr:GAF domain-containing protein [Xanthomonadaceae bacterium]MDE2083695.1 GAF domain-containing protein [Xanthomonadaceae bacterium]MDE2256191.1 GAF domain-containing protein [Xanthomonadaceae bacterium]